MMRIVVYVDSVPSTHSFFQVPIFIVLMYYEDHFHLLILLSLSLSLFPMHSPICFIFPVQFNVRVHHTPDTSVVIHSLDQSEIKTQKAVTRHPSQTQKPRGRCFQETTPKQAVSGILLILINMIKLI